MEVNLSVIDESKSILQEIKLPAQADDQKIYIKRDDLLHPAISGNKWRKLKYNLVEAANKGFNTILTFGGAYSNHIYAVASAGKLFGFKTIGIIRGEEHLPLNPTLTFAEECGMDIHYLDRTTYRSRNEKAFQNELLNRFGNAYVVPEGGTNMFALKGVKEIISEIDESYDYICCANGTGGTISGLIVGLQGNKTILGFPSLKGAAFLYDVIEDLVFEYTNYKYNNYKLILDYHFGGYAKINKVLVDFIEEFYSINSIPLDPVYTGKMMFGINDLLKNNYFPKGAKIVAVHTGGLQGNMGMRNKIEKLHVNCKL